VLRARAVGHQPPETASGGEDPGPEEEEVSARAGPRFRDGDLDRNLFGFTEARCERDAAFRGGLGLRGRLRQRFGFRWRLYGRRGLSRSGVGHGLPLTPSLSRRERGKSLGGGLFLLILFGSGLLVSLVHGFP
jgi:hypothetical protein